AGQPVAVQAVDDPVPAVSQTSGHFEHAQPLFDVEVPEQVGDGGFVERVVRPAPGPGGDAGLPRSLGDRDGRAPGPLSDLGQAETFLEVEAAQAVVAEGVETGRGLGLWA